MKLLNALITIIALTPLSSYAVPVKFSKCEEKISLKAPKNASGVFFDETCSTAYVLPPQSGSLELFQLRPTGNLELVCEQYNDIEESISAMTSSLRMYSQRIESYNQKAHDYLMQLNEGLIPSGMTIEDVEAKIDELLNKVEDYQTKYTNSINSLKNLKAYYARTEGAVGQFLLESNYVALVNEYQQNNPHVHFVRMPLEQSYIMINEKLPKEGDPINLPMEAVISITSPMADYIPLLKNIRDPKPDDVVSQKAPGGIFSDGLTGEMSLSAIGVCPMMSSKGLPDSIGMAQLEKSIQANVVYQYHLQMHKKHKITYNLAQLAKRIESSSKKGGFFSSKSVHSLTEKTESKKWITFEVYSNDPSHNYTEEYKKEIKEQFLNSVLQEVAYVSFDNPANYPSVVMPTGPNGAQVIGEGLGKCPHLYCQVGMYAMKFLDATFGKTSAISEYIKTRDVWSEESFDEKQMVPYVGSYTFK